MGATGEFIEYQNDTVGAYRAAHIVDDRLEACVYIGELPDRSLNRQALQPAEAGKRTSSGTDDNGRRR